MLATLTPNIGLNVPHRADEDWNVALDANWNLIDSVIGKVSDIGNYDLILRPDLSSIIGKEAGLSGSLISNLLNHAGRISQNETDILALQASITPAGLNSFDSNPTVKLNNATTFAEAINWLDGLFYEELNPSNAVVSKFPPINIADAILTFSPVAGAGTPVGVGILRWIPSRSAFGCQFYNQGAEGNEIIVTGNGTYTIYGHDGIGSIQFTVHNFAALPIADTIQQFSLASDIIDLSENVLTYGGKVACAAYDPIAGQWHFAFASPQYIFPTLTVTNDGAGAGHARVQTNYGGGFGNGVKIYYVNTNGQDLTAQAFFGYMESLLAQWALFVTGTLSSAVFTNHQTSFWNAIE